MIRKREKAAVKRILDNAITELVADAASYRHNFLLVHLRNLRGAYHNSTSSSKTSYRASREQWLIGIRPFDSSAPAVSSLH